MKVGPLGVPRRGERGGEGGLHSDSRSIWPDYYNLQLWIYHFRHDGTIWAKKH